MSYAEWVEKHKDRPECGYFYGVYEAAREAGVTAYRMMYFLITGRLPYRVEMVSGKAEIWIEPADIHRFCAEFKAGIRPRNRPSS